MAFVAATNLREGGVNLCVEIGPGKMLAGLIKRIDGGLKCVNVQGPHEFEAAPRRRPF